MAYNKFKKLEQLRTKVLAVLQWILDDARQNKM